MKFLNLRILAIVFMIVVVLAFSKSVVSNKNIQIKDGRPNILIIMVDDMGYSDLGAYGSEISTPNIDQLASSGLMMNNFYNAARCCPTRASLLTGQYQHKVGLTRNGESMTFNGLTIAEALKQNGYETAMVGKWHLSKAQPIKNQSKHLMWLNHQYNPDTLYADVKTYPQNRGFEKFYGIIWGVVNCYDPFSLVDGIKSVSSVAPDFYTTHAFTDKAIEYVNGFKSKPFFMYLAYNAPHWPVQAPEKTIKKYENTYLGGWDSLRRVRYNQLLRKKIINQKDYPYENNEEASVKWNTLNPSQKKNFSKRMATHAAMVDEVDQGVGKLIKQLKINGQYDNTVIFFLSDNGASPEFVNLPGYDRPSATRKGIKLQYGDVNYQDIGSDISYTSIGSGWANALNSPYRFWKAESYNGGIKTPMIISGPGVSKGMNNSIAHVMDIMPTCLELSKTSYPDTFNGHKLSSIDGHSLVSMMKGTKKNNYDNLFFEHEGGRALISGDYKIVALRKGEWSLFNIAKNKTETLNLAKSEPNKLQEMEVKWNSWANQMGLINQSRP
jgi:arylsulfatase